MEASLSKMARRRFAVPPVSGLCQVLFVHLVLVYSLCPGLAEPNTIKFSDSTANIKLNRFLMNLIIVYL